jgi:hypothetical protein
MSVTEQFLNQKEVAQLVYLTGLFSHTTPLDDRQRADILAHTLKTTTLEKLTPTLRDFAFQLIADLIFDSRPILDSLLAQNAKNGCKDMFLKRLSRFLVLVDRLFDGMLKDNIPPFVCEAKDDGWFLRVK